MGENSRIGETGAVASPSPGTRAPPGGAPHFVRLYGRGSGNGRDSGSGGDADADGAQLRDPASCGAFPGSLRGGRAVYRGSAGNRSHAPGAHRQGRQLLCVLHSGGSIVGCAGGRRYTVKAPPTSHRTTGFRAELVDRITGWKGISVRVRHRHRVGHASSWVERGRGARDFKEEGRARVAARVAPEGVPPLADDDRAALVERQVRADRLPGDQLLLGAQEREAAAVARRGRSRSSARRTTSSAFRSTSRSCSRASRWTRSSIRSRSGRR